MGRRHPEITHDEITHDAAGTVTLVRLRGEIDLVTAPIVRRKLLTSGLSAPSAVVVDLSETTFVDCSGLAAIAAAAELAHARGRTLVVRGAHGVVRRALLVSDLSGLLDDAPARRD